MQMMGLKTSVFVLSWLLTYFIEFAVISLSVTTMLKFSLLQHSSYSLLLVYFTLFVVSCLFLGFLISMCFSKAKLAGIISPIFLFASLMPRYAFFQTDDPNTDVTQKTQVSLLSPTAFCFWR